jgi:hypothetical protein
MKKFLILSFIAFFGVGNGLFAMQKDDFYNNLRKETWFKELTEEQKFNYIKSIGEIESKKQQKKQKKAKTEEK